MIKNISLKYNFTAHKNSTTNNTRHFEKYITMNEKRAFVMIDFEIQKNIISQQLIDKFETIIKFKNNSYDLITINKKSLKNNDKRILQKIISITLIMNKHEKFIFFDIIQMINHNIVLKIF